MNWTVTQVVSMTDKISVRLEYPGGHPVRMTWNGATRSYHYDGTGMKVEAKYIKKLEQALRNYFSSTHNE